MHRRAANRHAEEHTNSRSPPHSHRHVPILTSNTEQNIATTGEENRGLTILSLRTQSHRPPPPFTQRPLSPAQSAVVQRGHRPGSLGQVWLLPGPITAPSWPLLSLGLHRGVGVGVGGGARRRPRLSKPGFCYLPGSGEPSQPHSHPTLSRPALKAGWGGGEGVGVGWDGVRPLSSPWTLPRAGS